MKFSESQLAEITGMDRRTVKKRLDGLSFEDGDKGAKLYDSKEALRKLYTQSAASPHDALSMKRIEEIDLNMEIARHERPKRTEVIADFGQVCGKMGDMIRSFPNVPADLRKDLLTALREFLDRLEKI